MRIFLVRHAAAVDEGPRITDEARWLTVEGRRVARAVGQTLKQQRVEPALIVSSPLVRALQTAELIADALDYLGAVETLHALAPGVPARVAANDLALIGQDVLLVGHAPGISMIGAVLAQRPSFPPFKKGQACEIDGGKPGFTIDPDTLVVERLLLA